MSDLQPERSKMTFSSSSSLSQSSSSLHHSYSGKQNSWPSLYEFLDDAAMKLGLKQSPLKMEIRRFRVFSFRRDSNHGPEEMSEGSCQEEEGESDESKKKSVFKDKLKRILKQRFKVPPALNQFTKTVDRKW